MNDTLTLLEEAHQLHCIHLDEVDSTNNYLRQSAPSLPYPLTLATAEYQSSGRGQRGNSWESERGQNLIFSILVCPSRFGGAQQQGGASMAGNASSAGGASSAQSASMVGGAQLPVSHIFALSEACALAICDALSPIIPDVEVKWPNDIYYHDHKIAGILIETTLAGKFINDAIIGVGVNINQAAFHSDAPNPTSLRIITGETADRECILAHIVEHFHHHLTHILQGHFNDLHQGRFDDLHQGHFDDLHQGHFDDLHQRFMSVLYRRTGFHPYRDEQGTFQAQISGVEPSGHLLLTDTAGHLRRYAFKEVEFIIETNKNHRS